MSSLRLDPEREDSGTTVEGFCSMLDTHAVAGLREAIAAWAYGAAEVMMTVALYAALALPIGFVLSIFRRMRPLTGLGLVLFSWILGAVLWFWTTAITFASFGWLGLVVGLVLMGFGVVPLGLLGAFLEGGAAAAGPVLGMAALTFGLRFAGFWLMESGKEGTQP